MPYGIYSEEFETICLYCYLAPDKCIEVDTGAIGRLRGICPIKVAKRFKLEARQAKQLSEIARLRQYRPELFLRMAKQQAERNLIVVGGL
jgi:hypothetical protein